MKANEAPEKIWINSSQDLPCSSVDSNSIEYTRIDASIAKAENFLYEKLNSGEMECSDIVVFIEKFRNYMKGE